MERISFNELPKGMLTALMEVENYLKKSPFSTQFLELIRLRVAQLNGCAYCVDMHTKELEHAGETALRIHSLCIWEDTPYFSKKERAVLTFTEALTTLNNKPLDESIFNTLFSFYSKEEVSFLTLAVSQINTWTRIAKSFHFTPGNYTIGAHEN